MAGRRRAGPRTRTSAPWAGGSYQRSSEKPQKAMIGCVLCLVMFESLSQPRHKIGPDTQKIRKPMGSMRRFRTRPLAAPNQRWSYACCPGAKRTKASSMFQLRKRDTGRIHDFPDSFGVPPNSLKSSFLDSDRRLDHASEDPEATQKNRQSARPGRDRDPS